MKLKAIVAATAIAIASGGALATTTNLGQIDGTSKSIGGSFAGGAGNFTDTYNFTLAGLNTLTGIATTFDFGSLFGISTLSSSLTGGSIVGALYDTTPADGFTFANLGAGSYSFTITGLVTGTGGGAYGGVLQAAPVPEPGSLALVLAGLGVVAFVARRRSPQR